MYQERDAGLFAARVIRRLVQEEGFDKLSPNGFHTSEFTRSVRPEPVEGRWCAA
jgi:hypothetical protein